LHTISSTISEVDTLAGENRHALGAVAGWQVSL